MMEGQMPKLIILGFVLFLVPVICLALLFLIRGASTEKATGVSLFRAFAPAFFVAGGLYILAGFGLLKLPR